jgi:histone H3/H4
VSVVIFARIKMTTARETNILIGSAEAVALDLESFSRHAGRTTVTTDDVLLLARRNEDLHRIIKDFVDQQKAAKVKTNARR